MERLQKRIRMCEELLLNKKYLGKNQKEALELELIELKEKLAKLK